MIAMKSKSDFHNTRVVKDDGTHVVKPGDAFKTDWLHAKDLIAGGLAEAVDPKEMEKEPSEAIAGHSSVSAPDLEKINARRASKTTPVGGVTTPITSAPPVTKV